MPGVPEAKFCKGKEPTRGLWVQLRLKTQVPLYEAECTVKPSPNPRLMRRNFSMHILVQFTDAWKPINLVVFVLLPPSMVLVFDHSYFEIGS